MASSTFNPGTKDKPRGTEFDKAKDAGHDAMQKTREAGQDAMQKTKEAGQDMMQKSKEMGDEAMQKVKQAGTEVIGKAKETATAAGELASHAACAVGQKADDLTSAAGHGLREFGDTIAKKAPHDGFAGATSQAVAEGVKGSGQYIEEHKLSGMARDVEHVIKNHPIPALMICFGVGFCMGRMFKD